MLDGFLLAQDLLLSHISRTSGQAPNEKNVVFAPSTAFRALALVLQASPAGSRQAVLDAIGGETSVSAVDEMAREIQKDCSKHAGVKTAELVMMNAQFSPHFRTAVQGLQGNTSVLQDTPTPDKVNEWVSLATGGKIKSILDQEADFVVASALAFESRWDKDFQACGNGPFAGYTEDVAYMRSEQNVWSHVCESSTIVMLSFSNNTRAAFVTPHIADGWMQALGDLKKFAESAASTGNTGKGMGKGVVILPMFTMESSVDLLRATPALQAIEGMRLDVTADSSPLFVSSAKHAAFVQVDLHGAVAGGASAVSASRGLSFSKVFQFNAPFLFAFFTADAMVPIITGVVFAPRAPDTMLGDHGMLDAPSEPVDDKQDDTYISVLVEQSGQLLEYVNGPPGVERVYIVNRGEEVSSLVRNGRTHTRTVHAQYEGGGPYADSVCTPEAIPSFSQTTKQLRLNSELAADEEYDQWTLYEDNNGRLGGRILTWVLLAKKDGKRLKHTPGPIARLQR